MIKYIKRKLIGWLLEEHIDEINRGLYSRETEKQLLRDLAYNYCDQDQEDDDLFNKQQQEEIETIESHDNPQDDENYYWDNGYVEWYMQATRDARRDLEKLSEPEGTIIFN